MVESTSEAHGCLNNDEVRAYEPTLEDQFFIIPSGDYQRLIFSELSLREREETHLNDFRNFLKAKDLTLPAGYDDETRNVLRFLQGLKWDYQRTYDEVCEHAEWRAKVNVTDITPVKAGLESGMLYAYKRDKNMRPIVVVNVRRVIEAKIDIEALIEVVDFFTNYTIEEGMVPGKVENWTCIFDLRDVGAT
jgi:hypothetical protein